MSTTGTNNIVPITKYWSPTYTDSNAVVQNTVYKEKELVMYESYKYVSTMEHTASPYFVADFLNGRWTRSGRKEIVNWSTRSLNCVGDRVRFEHIMLTCRLAHESNLHFKQDLFPTLATLDLNRLVIKSYTFLAPWILGKTDWKPNDICELDNTLYLCTLGYNGLELDALYTPQSGTDWKSAWTEFLIWDAEPIRKAFAAGWFEQVPFLNDYVEQIDKTMLPNVDYPLAMLKNIRNINSETDLTTLKNTAVMQGINLTQFSSNLINPDSYYRYVSYLTQYKFESGTNSYIDFLNFIVTKPTALPQNVLPQYTVTEVNKVQWVTSPLYTRDYKTFWTAQELIIMYNRSANYTFIGTWQMTTKYSVQDCVYFSGWYWSSLVNDNIRSSPSLDNENWILVALTTGIIYGSAASASPPVPKPDRSRTLVNPEFDFGGTIPLADSTEVLKSFVQKQPYLGIDGRLEYEEGTTVDNKWTYTVPAQSNLVGYLQSDPVSTVIIDNASEFLASDLLYINDPHGLGYYQTSNVFLYRTDNSSRIGTDLEQYPEYNGILKLFYSLAPANVVVNTRVFGTDFTTHLMRVYELGSKMGEIEDFGFIPVLCSDLVTVVYPQPSVISGWADAKYGANIKVKQKNFMPIIPVIV